MKKTPFKTADFITSALLPSEYPKEKTDQGLMIPEIAFIGRSNVGKSSLINHLTKKKDLAKTSSTPGKTQRINFFLIDSSFFLVDLPGYGFAKVSKNDQEKWGQYLELYLNTRPLKALIFLIDSRRGLLDDDLTFLSWSQFKNIPIIPILTKSDKLSTQEQKKASNSLNEALRRYTTLLYSVKEGKCRNILIQIINKALWG